MADRTHIEWTDATWNPVRGCSRCSEGCRFCYAEGVAARFSGEGQAYHGFAERDRSGSKWTGKVALVPHLLTLPLRWRRPRRIFVNSMSDLFHEALSDDDIDLVFAVMALCDHTCQVLTKRAARMQRYMAHPDRKRRIGARVMCVSERLAAEGRPRIQLDHFSARFAGHGVFPNVWLGVSVENEDAANERIPHLLATPAAIRFLSCEPLLGPLDLDRVHGQSADGCEHWWESCLKFDIWSDCHIPTTKVDWVIAGGESGAGARPMHPDWARRLRDQCAAADVPFFFKQWGEWAPGECVDRHAGIVQTADFHGDRWLYGHENLAQHEGHIDDEADLCRIGKRAAGNTLDGVQHLAFPA